MEEQLLLKTSLVVSVIGLGALFFITTNPNFDTTPAGMVSPNDIGSGVKVCGVIEGLFTSKNNHTFFTLSDASGKIKIVVFSSTKTHVGSGDVCVTGKVDIYKGELEIIADVVEDV